LIVIHKQKQIQFKVFQDRNSITANGYVLAMVGHLKNVSSILAQMPNRITNVEFTAVSPTIAIAMLSAALLSVHLNYPYLLSF
jgi:hypothetical protein